MYRKLTIPPAALPPRPRPRRLPAEPRRRPAGGASLAQSGRHSKRREEPTSSSALAEPACSEPSEQDLPPAARHSLGCTTRFPGADFAAVADPAARAAFAGRFSTALGGRLRALPGVLSADVSVTDIRPGSIVVESVSAVEVPPGEDGATALERVRPPAFVCSIPSSCNIRLRCALFARSISAPPFPVAGPSCAGRVS